MINYKDEKINVIQTEIDELEELNPQLEQALLSQKYAELRQNANLLEEYLDLKETALAEVRELRGLIESNKKLYKNYIAANVTQRIESHEKTIQKNLEQICELQKKQSESDILIATLTKQLKKEVLAKIQNVE